MTTGAAGRLGRLGTAAAVALAASLLGGAEAGCAREAGVLRVVDGRVVEGPYVEPEAYAAFLDGAIKEDSGDLRGALAAYVEAAHHDSEDAEIWTRIAAVECKIDPRRPGVNLAIEQALRLDPTYAGAFGVRAACAMARGEPSEDAAARAVAADPMADELQILLARAATGPRATEAARERLVALTLVHAGRAAAWEALAAWARTQGDVPLYARALSELSRRGLGDRAGLASAVEVLAGEGELTAARTVAGGLADGSALLGSPLASARYPLVARLAVDDAVGARDVDLVRLRAVRTHLALDLAAARAVLLGEPGIGRELASGVAAADPRALGARLVLACAAGEPGAPALASPGDAAAPAEAALAYGRLLSRVLPDSDAAAALAAVRHEPLVAGDALTVPIATELAARGILPERDLPLDARVELAARNGQPAPPAALDPPGAVDARHELLALATSAPASPRAQALAARLAARADDPLVAVALARIDLAAHPDHLAPDAGARLLDKDPADPLVAATALDVARHARDVAATTRAKAALAAVARTTAERALLE